MNDMVLAVNATIGREASKCAKSLENKVKASMRSVLKGNWMETREDEIFKASVGGVLLDVGEESKEGQLLIKSIKMLQRFQAAFAAAAVDVPVNFEAIVDEDDKKCLPLLSWWQDVKKETGHFQP